MALNASKDLTITLRVSLPHREFPLLFYIRAEDLTWKNLLITLFGHNDFEEDKQPHIQYIRNGRRCNLSDDRRVMNDFIRFALLTPSRETGITLLIRKYDDYCNMKKSTTTTTPPLVKNAGWPSKNGIHEYCETDLKLNDIVKIFDTKLTDEHIRNGILSDLNSNLPYNKLERDPHFKHWVINNSYREEGNLSVRRLDGEEFTKVIKSGVHVVVTRENGEYLLLKFNKESIPSMYEMRLNWTMPEHHSLKCDDLKIPVSIEKEMNFVFPQDAEFVKNFESNINVKQSTSTKASNQPDSATTSSPPETQQTPWWPSETSQTLPPSRNAHLWGVSGEMKSCSRVENDKQKPSSSKKKLSTKSPYVWPSYAGWIPNAPNFGFRWDYQRQCWQTVDNSSQKNFDPWGAQVTSNGSTQTVQTPAKRSPPVVLKPTSDWDKWEKINENAGVQQTAENKQSLVDDGAAKNSTMPPPKWLKDELDKFKEQINEEMKKTMKSIVDTIQQTKVNSPSTSGHGKYSRKTLPAEFVTGLETLTINEKKHRSAEGSRKRKLAVPAPGKALEICSELSIVSMSGFKVRMPRNASMTLKLTLVKYGKYRTSREEPEPRVTSASDGIECCVTTAGVENMHSWYDVRIKTKDKSGKFRFVFNVMHNGKPVGRAVHFVVRVKRTYTLPVVPDLIDLNSEPSQYGEAVEGAVADVTSGSRAFEDEGIGGNQEDFYSPTSDSEDSMDADEANFAQTKTDVPKDEGIDTCYPVAKKDDLSWEVFSDSDTDSSISFLMDESEARDKEMDTEVVNLPSCFITNASSNEETLSVRVVRKRDHTRAIKKGKTSDASTSSDLELLSTKANETTTDSDPTPAALKEQAERAYNRSMYPNLQGLKEFVNPLPEKPTEQAKPSTSETKAEPCPVNILHEKVFEAVGTMWNKVYQTKKTFSETLNETDTLHKQVKDTVTCVAAKAVQEAKAAVTAAQAAAAAATTAANSVPTQTQGSAPNVFNVETLESAARAVAAAASAAQAAVAAATTAAYTQPSQTATASTMTIPQPSTSAKPATASSPQHSQPESEIDGACASSTSTTPNDSEKDSKKETTRMHNIYVNLSEETLQQLAILNDMGFTDDHYSIYLLNQFSNDLNKVVENLIHYSSL